MLVAAIAQSALAEPQKIRVASWNSAFSRDGPGLLLRDILRGDDAQIVAGLAMIQAVRPDILLINNFDFDHGRVAARSIAKALQEVGLPLPFVASFRPNTGTGTAFDIDRDGYLGGPGDAQGWGEFAGQGGMLVLSKYPFDLGGTQDFSDFLWLDLPDNLQDDGAELAAVQKLSSVGQWALPVNLPGGSKLTLLAWHATTPVFDHADDRNGRRNHDENMFWAHLLDGTLDMATPDAPFVLLGSANLDPQDGEGHRGAIADLLEHPGLQDPKPRSRGAAQASAAQGGANAHQSGDPGLDTSDWRDDPGPGNLRVQYVLPSRDLNITDAGVYWPASDEIGYDLISGRDPRASWHGLVWVDISR